MGLIAGNAPAPEVSQTSMHTFYTISTISGGACFIEKAFSSLRKMLIAIYDYTPKWSQVWVPPPRLMFTKHVFCC